MPSFCPVNAVRWGPRPGEQIQAVPSRQVSCCRDTTPQTPVGSQPRRPEGVRPSVSGSPSPGCGRPPSPVLTWPFLLAGPGFSPSVRPPVLSDEEPTLGPPPALPPESPPCSWSHTGGQGPTVCPGEGGGPAVHGTDTSRAFPLCSQRYRHSAPHGHSLSTSACLWARMGKWVPGTDPASDLRPGGEHTAAPTWGSGPPGHGPHLPWGSGEV